MAVAVVTGATGFVGGALVRRLLAAGDRVRAVVAPADPSAPPLYAMAASQQLEVIEADVRDAAALAPAFAGSERVFHAAALVHAWAPADAFVAVNVGGAANVARAARAHGVGRVVHVSTSDVFGLADGARVLDERSPFRRWDEPYADSKIAAEELLWRAHRDDGLPLSVVYPGWVYGPGDRAFFPGLADAIAAGFMVFWARDVRLAWTYVENLVDACLAVSADPRAVGEGYLAFDTLEGPTLEEVGARIATRIGARRPWLHVPYPAALAIARTLETIWRTVGARTGPPLRTVDVKAFGDQWRFSNAKLRALGWSPRVDVDAGMEAALDFLAATRVRTRADRPT